ncbi:Cupredoxin [Hyaloscypha variabilis F]|uniref:Cupredoxin n=1 Tax=Hyaloscypha variabilis (strain UAMH 11265 / GT02V1 / F) TaxID=1149755 RepID=A0A2J6RP05_HYAVF|nr:Cupredoxin [Hyaloscypha variabilis F]
MHFSTALAAAASAALAQAVTIPVTVGNGALKFVPNDITANIGDQIEFSFFPKNHSVTQSSFADPCHPLAGGFFSTFIPTNSTSPEVFTLTVNDTKPIWIYCAQTKESHCQSGMVAAINAPATGNTLAAFTLKAANATTSTSPPDTVPIGGVLAVKGKEIVVTTSVTEVVTATGVRGGSSYQTTYETAYGTTYSTDLQIQATTLSSGSGSGSGNGGSAATATGSTPSVTTSVHAGAATAVGANGAMVGAVVLGALALL